MKNITESIRKYFSRKEKNEPTSANPEGVCPNCWGQQEWDGQYYKLMKAKNITPDTDRYNSFIKEFVTNHIDGIVINEDTYTCTTCMLVSKNDV